jgi:cytochrome c peroxidase
MQQAMRINNPVKYRLCKSTVIVSLFFIGCLFTGFSEKAGKQIETGYLQDQSALSRDEVVNYYLQCRDSLKQKIILLKNFCLTKEPAQMIKKAFLGARLAFKQMAVITDYFNIYETKFLNGPALPRVEDDNPQVIIAPSGFQVIEEMLWKKKTITEYEKLCGLCEAMLQVIQTLEQEPDFIFKFRDDRVMDALRLSLIRLMTTGISGFDSPVALHSLPEAAATLQSIENILRLYTDLFEKKDDAGFKNLITGIQNCRVYLADHTDFNSFDRLVFITNFINPVFRQLALLRISAGIPPPEGLNPTLADAGSIFSKNFFNLDFYSPNNQYLPSKERIDLGKKLFADPLLSGTKTRSCASCHQPEKALTDGLKTALAIDGKKLLTRNTPTLWNSVLQTKQFFDSRVTVLENQFSEVVHNPDEMRGSLKQSVTELSVHRVYSSLFRKAYPAEKNPVSEYTIANAVSSYIRSLVALDSRFDQYMRGDNLKMNENEKNGFNLFTGKAKCATCHFLPLFNGLVPPEFTETESEVLGVPSSNNKKRTAPDRDKGRMNFTGAVIHEFAFKTPTLRNIELTAPYMHNGVFTTLEEVMEFYNKGGGAGLKIAPANQTLPAEPLQLTKKEIADIISFMKTLTDTRDSL